jgi:hypothetical protein
MQSKSTDNNMQVIRTDFFIVFLPHSMPLMLGSFLSPYHMNVNNSLKPMIFALHNKDKMQFTAWNNGRGGATPPLYRRFARR